MFWSEKNAHFDGFFGCIFFDGFLLAGSKRGCIPGVPGSGFKVCGGGGGGLWWLWWVS